MKRKYVAVIQAGGKGSRMSELTYDEIPKPLLKINGKTMIEWQIESLAQYGIYDFVIIVGHLGYLIQDYFGDGTKWNIRINYIYEKEPLGSAGALYYIKEYIGNCDVVLVFGDVMFELDWERFINFHEKNGGYVSLLAHPNAHPYDSDLLIVNENNEVVGIDSKKNKRDYTYKNCVNAGLSIFRNELLDIIEFPKKIDFETELVEPLMKKKMVYAYSTPEYVKDAGTPERFYCVCREQLEGIWKAKCLTQKQRAIFLDRDGTINVFKGFLKSEKDFELLPHVSDAIKKINESKYLAIIITNQPVIARGECTVDELDEIHKKLETLLGSEGAFINDLYYCPHHPHSGFEGEIKELKFDCDCRKPKIGMLLQAAEKYNIDLLESWYVGDTTVDIQTGVNAGMRTVLVHTGEAGEDRKYAAIPDYEASDLQEAVEIIINYNHT